MTRLAGASGAAPADERTLVERMRAGDPRALEAFYRAHVNRVTRAVGRLIGPTADLEDLVQSTFVEAIRSIPRYRGEASLATWVTRIAVHVAQHHLRRGVRRSMPLEALPEADVPAAHPTVERVLDDRSLAARVHGLLDRIAPPKRIAFLLYAIEGCSVEEVAALMDAGRAATKSRIWFARREVLALARRDPLLRRLVRPSEEVES